MNLLKRIHRSVGHRFEKAGTGGDLNLQPSDPSASNEELSKKAGVLEALCDALPTAILLIDELGNVGFANLEAKMLFFDEKEPQGLNFLQLLGNVSPDLRAALLSETDHIFSFGADGNKETYHLARRQMIWAETNHSVFVVRNMTHELSRQENAILRRAIRVIHHEFANSVAPVRSLLQSARAKVGQPEWAPKLEQTLQVIEERILHLSAFLSGFSALGRLPTPRPEKVAWETFLGRIATLDPDIYLGAPPSGDGWFDPTQIEQVLINLIKNAREAKSPAAEIRVEATAIAEGGCLLAVRDRGEGLNDETLENACFPSYTTKPKGSGMGLALCREIVDAHGGRLRLARREGGGAIVSFWLPGKDAPSFSAAAHLSRLSLTRSE